MCLLHLNCFHFNQIKRNLNTNPHENEFVIALHYYSVMRSLWIFFTYKDTSLKKEQMHFINFRKKIFFLLGLRRNILVFFK